MPDSKANLLKPRVLPGMGLVRVFVRRRDVRCGGIKQRVWERTLAIIHFVKGAEECICFFLSRDKRVGKLRLCLMRATLEVPE